MQLKNLTAHRALHCAALTLMLACSVAHADDDLQANPYRPSVGSPASLSAPKHIEAEFGVANANASGSNIKTSPFLLKYAFNESIGVTVGLNPLMQVSVPGMRTRGMGDGTVTLKLAQKINEGFSIGEELTSTLPIASHNLGTDKSDQTFNFILSNDFSGFHTDINLNATHFGDDQGAGVAQHGFGWSAGISHPIIGRLSGGLELSGTAQSGTDSTLQVLESIGFSITKLTVFDLYAAQAKDSNDQRNYTFGFGVTHLFN